MNPFEMLFKQMAGSLGSQAEGLLSQFTAQQETLRKKTELVQVTGEAAAGKVKVTLNGLGVMTKCEIDASVLALDGSAAIVGDLVSAAHAAAHRRLSEELQSLMLQMSPFASE